MENGFYRKILAEKFSALAVSTATTAQSHITNASNSNFNYSNEDTNVFQVIKAVEANIKQWRMEKDTLSSQRVKDKKNSGAKRGHNTIKGSTESSPETLDKSDLRKTASGDSVKKMIVDRYLSTRKSERLEKQTPQNSPVKRKSERIEKQQTPSPLRRSERCTKQSSSTSSGLKKSNRSSSSSDIKDKQKRKDKSVKILKVESARNSKSVKKNEESGQVKNKRMDGRTYMALLKKRTRRVILADHQEDQNIQSKPSHCAVSSCSGEMNGGNDIINKREEMKIHDVGRASEGAYASQNHISFGEASEHDDDNDNGLCSSDNSIYASPEAIAKQTINEHERADLDISAEEIQIAACITWNSPLNDSRDDWMNLERDCEIPSLKRKRNSADTDAEIPSPPPSSSSSSFCLEGSLVETCSSCLKRQRINFDTRDQEFCMCTRSILETLAFIDVHGVVHEEPEPRDSRTIFENCYNLEKQIESSADIGKNIYQSACFTCKLGGKLLCCNGRDCGRSFHISCIDPPLEDLPFGVWHCIACVKKKIEFGVHSVSEGIESVWDSREELVSDAANGFRKQRQYFVKYKDLAHFHNKWVPESELLADFPSLLSKYDSKIQWKQEWAVPHRLLQKRFLLSSTHSEENGGVLEGKKCGCRHEWLVKWHGLDYEHATWELENASFITSSLVHNFENRCTKAMVAFNLDRENKIQEKKRIVAARLRDDDPSGLSDNHLDYVNKLCEFWHKGLNAVIIDDQDRIAKVVAFILTLQPGTYHPFLIISTHTAICLWDIEFMRSAPSVNAVVYKGNKKNRNSIRLFEFYGEGGCITFDVLVIPSEIILQDQDLLDSIKWEVVIVDECDRPIISSKYEQIKKLTTDMKLLLFNHLKDSKDEYVSVLSLLDFNVESSIAANSMESSVDNIGTLKERFSRHIAYAYTSRLVEYWVPAQISHVQLEQYCSTLLANSTSLRSLSRCDHVGALRDILISTRKCCNHPYILDPSLQTLLTKDLEALEYLDVGVKASGKLQLLDVMLMEMKKRCLRVLILFKSNSGSGRDSIGDILDDFLRQRFGADSYERVEGGLLHSKKLVALNKFNDIESQRFVFLLEFRACLPSIKLSSVDSVIIYDSDWTPMNDLRALQKITIDPQFDQIKIFRLYSSCTVEEKALMLASQNKTIDNSLQNISCNTSHMLLIWGASLLFDNLEKFLGSNIPALTASTSAKESFLQNVVHDLLSILPQKDGRSGTHDLHVMLQAHQVEGSYHTGQPLLGELKIPQTHEILPHRFWCKLLEGKHPQWRFSSVSCQRNRKKVRCQLKHELPKKSDNESDKVVKRRKKVSTSEISQTFTKFGSEKETTGREKQDSPEIPETLTLSPRSISGENNPLGENNPPISCQEISHIAEIIEADINKLDEEKELCNTQKPLYPLLSPGILKLCQILQLPENVKHMVEIFLVYVINNHRISQEPATILQAFQLSLCWTAAYWLKFKIDHEESMALAKERLNFDCQKEEADYVYSRLRCLKNMFLCDSAKKKVAKAPRDSEVLSAGIQNLPATQLATSLNSKTVKVEVEDCLQNQKDKQVALQPEMDSGFKLACKDVLTSVKVIRKRGSNLLSKLIQKQQEQKDELIKSNEEVNLRLEKNYRMESAVIRSLHGTSSIGTAKLKILEKQYARKIEEQKSQMEIRLKALETEHLDARNKVQEKEAHWVEELKSRAQDELLNKQSPNKTRHENSQYVSEPHDEEECPEEVVENLQDFRGKESEVPETIPDKVVECTRKVIVGPCRQITDPNDNDVELGTVSKEASVAEFEEPDKIISSNNVLENAVTVNSCSLELDSGVPTSSCMLEGDGPVEIPGPAIANDSVEHDLPLRPSIPEALLINRDSISLPDIDAPCEQLGFDCLSKAPDGALSLPLFETNGASTGIPDKEVLQQLPESLCLSVNIDCAVPMNQGKNPSEAILIMLNEEVPLGVSSSTPENLLPVFEDQIPGDVTVNIHDEEIPPQTQECASGHVAEDNCDSQINGMDISVSDYAFEINQQDTLCNVNNESILSHETSNGNLLAVPPSGTTMTQVSPVLSNQDECTLPSTCPESLVPVTLLPSTEPQSSRGVEYYQSNEDRSFSQQAATNFIGQPPVYFDPLQNEFERIRKATEEFVKGNNEKRAQLKSDCDKEIEEVIAQIRHKYETKLQEAETELILGKKELDGNYYKVLISKFLAITIESTCMDLRLPATSGFQQDVISTSMQQRQLPQQNAQRHPLPSSRVPTMTPSSNLPAGSLQSISLAPNPHPLSTTYRSIPPTRPPLIGSISPAANLQIGGTIRSPAPHLQPFRPSSTVSPSCLPRDTQNLQVPSNPPPSAPLFPQLQPQLPLPSNHSPAYSGASEPEGSVNFTIPNSSISTLGGFIDLNKRSGIDLPNLPDFSPHLNASSGLSACITNRMPVNLGDDGGLDIVCLSDDD